MPTISAANNLTIRYDEDHWRLFAGRSEGVLPVAEAGAEGLAYGAAFGTARNLPVDGLLQATQIAMIVVGWAIEDSHWHLGILLAPEVAATRGGRWCGLARWDFPDGDQAEKSGQGLAQILKCPFRMVPPAEAPASGGESPASASPASRVVSSVPLLPLPINMGDWQLREDDILGLLCERTARWRRDEALRVIIYGALTTAFGALSIGALTTQYAPVQPEWLPLIGLAISAIMLLIAFSHIFALTRALTTIIDSHLCMVRQVANPRRTVSQMPFEGVEAVIISHVINRREKWASGNRPNVRYDKIAAEVWIHLSSARRGFTQVCYLGDVDGQIESDTMFQQGPALNLDQINTPAHHAALYIAAKIDVPAYAEER